MIDLFADTRNPLNGAAIGRPTKRELCHPFLESLLEKWTSYLSAGFGRSFTFEIDQTRELLVDDIPYKGKVHLGTTERPKP